MKKRVFFTILLSLILMSGSLQPALAAQETQAAADEEVRDAEEEAQAADEDAQAAENENESADQTEESETETEPETLENGEPRLDSEACCVMDQKTGMILYQKNMDEKHYPASITKILTALVFLEHIKSLDEVVTFSEECWDGIDHYANMNIDMIPGEKLTAEQCLYAMLVASANEVCNQVAIYTAGSIPAFADMMNERAARIGCTGSHFVTPNGLHDPDHYLTAHDMALISREAMNNETFRKITATPTYTIKSTNMRKDPIELGSKHLILRESHVHDDACVGGKTGWTEEANETLVTFMDKNDMLLVCVVLDNSKSTPCKDTLKAVNYCYEQYTRSSIDQAAAQAAAETETAAAETQQIGQETESPAAESAPEQTKTTGSGSPADRIVHYVLTHSGILFPAVGGGLVLLSLFLVWVIKITGRKH